MARYFGLDITTDINDKLVAELNAMITTIDGERGTTTPQVKEFRTEYDNHQLPLSFLQITDSTVADNEGELNNDIDREIEIFNGVASISFKSNNRGSSQSEVYIEALQRVIHGFYNTGITWTVTTGTVRDEINTRQNFTLRVVGVEFIVRVN